MDFVIVQAHPMLLTYVDHLQRKNAEALSFYPSATFEREAERGRIFLSLLNGEPCGYIYVGAANGTMRCHQVCIEYGLRRRLYGAALVAHVEAYAVARGVYACRLRCGFDLDANTFWRSMGYVCISVEQGGVRRMRKINVWRKQLQPELFLDLECEPATGKTDASVWRRGKQTGLVTQFVRGGAMQEYRAEVVRAANQEGGRLSVDEAQG